MDRNVFECCRLFEWAVKCDGQTSRFLFGKNSSIETKNIGRRVSSNYATDGVLFKQVPRRKMNGNTRKVNWASEARSVCSTTSQVRHATEMFLLSQGREVFFKGFVTRRISSTSRLYRMLNYHFGRFKKKKIPLMSSLIGASFYLCVAGQENSF